MNGFFAKRPQAWLLLTLLVVAFLSFFKLGQQPVHPWDEARQGINAIEMLQRSDYIGSYYAGYPDTWTAKPPLSDWLTGASFLLLGKTEFALRLPSALAIIVAFFFIFRIIALYRSPFFAACTCLLLASVKGLIGWHVGRTGDTDALLVCLLMAATYFFLRWLDFEKRAGLLWAGLFCGIAFWVKGPASLVLLPGWALYAALSGRTNRLLRSPMTWGATLVFLLFPLAWWLAERHFGHHISGNPHGEGTAFERSFGYDLWQRFTAVDERWKPPFEPSFMFTSLDKCFNLWHLAFFGVLVYWLFRWAKNRRATWLSLTQSPQYRLPLLSLCAWLPLSFFLAMAAKSNTWYLAPALPFVGIATFFGIRHFWKKHRAVRWGFWALLAFTLCRRGLEFATPRPKPPLIATYEGHFRAAPCIVQQGWVEQDVLLYLYFFNAHLRFADSGTEEGCLLVLHKNSGLPMPGPLWRLLEEVGEYQVYERRPPLVK